MSATDIRVRVKLILNAQGQWVAYGWSDAEEGGCDSVLRDMMSDQGKETARAFYLVADVPLPPPPPEIKANIERVETAT